MTRDQKEKAVPRWVRVPKYLHQFCPALCCRAGVTIQGLELVTGRFGALFIDTRFRLLLPTLPARLKNSFHLLHLSH